MREGICKSCECCYASSLGGCSMLHELYIISGNVFTMFVFSEASVVYWQPTGRIMAQAYRTKTWSKCRL